MKRAKRRCVYRFKRLPLPKFARDVVEAAMARWMARICSPERLDG